MKKILTSIAALAMVAGLASCKKELSNETPVQTDGVRVISASFSTPVKSVLDVDGKTPLFVGGEIIKVSNGVTSEDCTIDLGGNGNASFSTTLSGTLTAVYPSTAAKMEGNIIDESAVLVPTVQDGTFASANIAMATNITTSALFVNKTAVFKITPGAGEDTKYVEVITARPEIANVVPTGSEFTKLNKIHVNSASSDAVYVSILVPEGLKVRDLSFADGNNIKTAKDITDAIAVNTINEVGSNGWNTPYVEIGGLKWATRNVGATADKGSDSYGLYFPWGDTNGSALYSGTSLRFNWNNCPFCVLQGQSPKFNKYIPTGSSYLAPDYTADNKTILDLSDDAANVNWGGSWRIATGGADGEFANLAKACQSGYTSGTIYPSIIANIPTGKGIYWYNVSGNEGAYFVDGNGNKIFFPAAGVGDHDGYSHQDIGNYWASTIYSNTPHQANYFFAASTHVIPADNYNRYYARPVRPVSD